MKKMMVLYPHPSDKNSFLSYYREKHLPMIHDLPGLVSAAYSVSGEDTSPYFVFFEAVFETMDALQNAIRSDVGGVLASDVTNFSPAGAVIVTADLVVLKA